MQQHLTLFAAFAATALVACSDGPTHPSDTAPVSEEIVITQGVPTPEWVPVTRVANSQANAQPILEGSVGTPLSLRPAACGTSPQLSITYVISGNQSSPASFKVNTAYQYNGATWAGSSPITVNVAPKQGGGDLLLAPVAVTVTNASPTSDGTSSFSIVPFDVVTNLGDAPGQRLSLGSTSSVAVYVAFAACDTPNTPPTLFVPTDITAEATGATGATVLFAVSATDAEDGDLTAAVTCDWASGDTFPLGTTTVTCSVTDSDAETTSASFEVTVEDTTPAEFTSFPAGLVTLIAADIDGAVLVIGDLGIAVEDWGNVSEPATFACDYVAGTALAIGSTTTVSCTATDARGNESVPSTFDVFVGLNTGTGDFLPPLRMSAPFSAHKRGSTIPHKFVPPTYADGTPATDLAAGLRLAIAPIVDELPGAEIEVNDFAPGSTEWRYDADAGHYIFNLKTVTAWSVGTWQTTVSYAGIPLAQTEFALKR